MNKEQIYDEKIMPLMNQILEISEQNGIAMIATFAIPTEEQPDLRCTSATLDENGTRPTDHAKALAYITRGA